MEYQVGDKVILKQQIGDFEEEIFTISEISGISYFLLSNVIRVEKWAANDTFRPLRILEAADKLKIIKIVVNNQEEYDTLMRFFDENNIRWQTGDKASKRNYWKESSIDKFYINLNSNNENKRHITYGQEERSIKINNEFRYSYFDELKQYEPVKFASSNVDFADAMSYATSYLNSDKITVCADRFNIPDGYKLDGRYLDEEFIKQPYFKEENIMKILDIYEEKQTKLIEKKYDKQIEELEEDDRLRVYFKQVEETVREMLELTEDEICTVSLNTPVISLTKETIAKKEEIIKLIREEKAELKNKIKEIQALLEFAPDYEETMQILRDYGIIDKKKNIIL